MLNWSYPWKLWYRKAAGYVWATGRSFLSLTAQPVVCWLWNCKPFHDTCIQVKLECAGGGRETQQTGLSRAAAAASLKVSLLGIEKVKIHHHFSWKELSVSCGIKKKDLSPRRFLSNSRQPMNQNKLKRATFCQFDLRLSCKYSKREWSTFWSLRLLEKSRHQAGLRCFATDRDKPRDFISFLPEPAKLVSPFALGQEGLCGAARWPPETTIIQMIQQNSRLKSKINVVKLTLLTWRAEEINELILLWFSSKVDQLLCRNILPYQIHIKRQNM